MTHSSRAIWPSNDPEDFDSNSSRADSSPFDDSFSTAKSEETEWYVSSLFRILFPMTCVENNIANRSFNTYVSHPTHLSRDRERGEATNHTREETSG
eukprot:scaffold386512_cov61-Attheya_sp.AAC.1